MEESDLSLGQSTTSIDTDRSTDRHTTSQQCGERKRVRKVKKEFVAGLSAAAEIILLLGTTTLSFLKKISWNHSRIQID